MSSREFAKELCEAPLFWPSEKDVINDQHHFLFRGLATKIKEDRQKEVHILSLERLTRQDCVQKCPSPRSEYRPPLKRQRLEALDRHQTETF